MGHADIADVLAGRARWCVVEGDCLDVLAAAPAFEIAACVMDPPYASGARTEAAKPARGAGMVRSARWGKRPIDCDQMTTPGFVWTIRTLALTLTPRLPPGASILSFIDWRQWPNLVGALESANFRINTMIVWDKETFGMGQGFRLQHELVCWASKGHPRVCASDVPNVLRHKRADTDDHPSPKPVPLMEQLLRVVTAEDDLVLDPFGGGGATGAAALRLRRRCILIERDPGYAASARERLLAEERGSTLEAARSGQAPLPLFGPT
jgi:site-specific DNA-methyltransferase (adenine-specific)